MIKLLRLILGTNESEKVDLSRWKIKPYMVNPDVIRADMYDIKRCVIGGSYD